MVQNQKPKKWLATQATFWSGTWRAAALQASRNTYNKMNLLGLFAKLAHMGLRPQTPPNFWLPQAAENLAFDFIKEYSVIAYKIKGEKIASASGGDFCGGLEGYPPDLPGLRQLIAAHCLCKQNSVL